MTLGDLLRQDGALALLAIGAVLGFLAGAFFRVCARKKESSVPQAAVSAVAPPAPVVVPPPAAASVVVPAASVIAAITAAVNRYQSENV